MSRQNRATHRRRANRQKKVQIVQGREKALNQTEMQKVVRVRVEVEFI
jgi:hypothetical protein